MDIALHSALLYALRNYMNVYEEIFILLASFSTFLSLLVILTGVIWPGIMLSKSKPFSTILFYTSLADFCSGIVNCLGFPTSGSEICNVQAFGTLYFSPASWLWTLMLVYQLRTLIIFKSINLSMRWMHLICWSIPLIPAFLPQTTNSYGQDDSLNGVAPCILGGDSTTKYIWINTTKTGLAILCFLMMLIWSVEIHLYICKCNGDSGREVSLFNSMKLYPLILFVTWIPKCVVIMLINAKVIGVNQILATCVITFSTQYGSLLTITYFSRSSVSRLLWFNLLKRICLKGLGSHSVLATHLSVMDEDERLIQTEYIESHENVLVAQAMEQESNRLRDSLLELRESSVVNIII